MCRNIRTLHNFEPHATTAELEAAALQDVQSALDSVRQAQQSGNFADYGQALQRLDDAMKKYSSTK